MGWEGHKSLISLILGIVVGAFGLVPILNAMGTTTFTLPALPETVLLIILIAGGAYLVLDGIMEVAMFPAVGWISILIGAASAVIGFLTLIGKAAGFGFLEGAFLNVILAVVGFLLLIGAFMF
jgi:hypothetical protein|tara:strand:+ start:5159 stop:5527 length:369 start_codon:yes stop_codon:yes gene_type:complete